MVLKQCFILVIISVSFLPKYQQNTVRAPVAPQPIGGPLTRPHLERTTAPNSYSRSCRPFRIHLVPSKLSKIYLCNGMWIPPPPRNALLGGVRLVHFPDPTFRTTGAKRGSQSEVLILTSVTLFQCTNEPGLVSEYKSYTCEGPFRNIPHSKGSQTF